MKSHKRLIWLIFGMYCFAVFWITLLSRIGKGGRALMDPFWSYREIANGDLETLGEDIKNVLLLVPFGFLLGTVTGWKRRYIILSGMFFSILIESCQWIFKLGTTEIDDVINNTIGAVIGALIVNRKGKGIVVGTLFIFVLIVLPLVLRAYRSSYMDRLASLHDRADGTKNLLVLDGNLGNKDNSGIHLQYLSDGSIHIYGSSGRVSYKLISSLVLDSGSYILTGFSGVEPETVGIYLEKSYDNYRFTPDLGPVEAVSFQLEESEVVHVYVKVYPGVIVDCVASPVIYPEN